MNNAAPQPAARPVDHARTRPFIPASIFLAGLMLLQIIPPGPGLEVEYCEPADGSGVHRRVLARRGESLREGRPLFNPAGIELPEKFQAVYTGNLHVDIPIRYLFWIIAPDPVRLWIDDQPVTATRAQSAATKPGVIRLESGLHPIRIEYTRAGANPEPPRLDLDWSIAWFKREPLPRAELVPPGTAPWRLHARGPLWALVGAAGLHLLLLRFVRDPRRRRWFYFRAVAVAATILIGCLIGELALRVAGARTREYIPADIWLDYDFEPGKTVLYAGYVPYNIKEFENEIRMNHEGWRDREYAMDKPAKTRRILVLGDSYVEAKEVGLEETFHKILERKLNSAPPEKDTRYEVLALARGGWGTVAELKALDEFGLAYRPDLVVLSFFAGNDVHENSPYLSNLISVWNREIYFDRIVRAKLEFSSGWLVFDNSYLNHLFVDGLMPFYVSHLNWFNSEIKKEDLTTLGIQLHRRGLYPRGWDEAWRTTLETIVKIKKTVEKNQAGFLLMNVYPDLVRGYDADASEDRQGSLELDRPLKMLQELCAKESIELLNLKPAFTEYESRTGQRLTWHYDAHWNPAGHRLAAEELFKRLTTQTQFSGLSPN